MKLIKVELRQSYGRDLIYPVCDQAKLFAKLMNVKTFTLSQTRTIIDLGYKVDTINPNVLNLLFN